MRIKRTTGSSTYYYTYHGSQLTHMTYGSKKLHFYYDASGNPFSVTYDGATYYYVLNLQGDVVAILDSSGVQVVGYTYDAWGKLLGTTGSKASTLGFHNPLRYRGYVYDWETGLYYLQSRYYNPEIGRFINADAHVSTGQGILGNNMFAYCGNNPVSRGDASGQAWETAFDVVSLGASALDVIANPTNAWAWAGLAGDVVDLIPFVTGVGESVDALRVANVVVEGADTAKAVCKGGKKAEAVSEALHNTRKQAFRQAKQASGIPKSAQYRTHKFVYDGSTENRIVFEFDVNGQKKYIIEHPFDKMGRGNHFHGADASKGSPFNKGRYNQYDGHFPEDFYGFY